MAGKGNGAHLKAKRAVCAQIAKVSGVSVSNVAKVLDALGMDERVRLASKFLDGSPTARELRLLYGISTSSIPV